MNELIGKDIINANGVICTHSTIIAGKFDKRHDNVLRDIENIIIKIQPENNLLKFEEIKVESYSRYFVRWDIPDSKNRSQKGYAMTRDGFSLLVMGFSGVKAMEWKVKFLDAFNAMEETLKNQVPQLTEKQQCILDIYEGGTAGVNSAKKLAEIEVKEATAPLVATIAEQKPKVELYDALHDDVTYDFKEVASMLGFKDIGRNKLFEVLECENILMKDKTPYRAYSDYFKVIPIANAYCNKKTVVKGSKGINFIRKRLLKLGYEVDVDKVS